MSLILEALRKSEQERRQNAAPRPDAQALSGATVVQVTSSHGVLWGAAAVVLAALGFAAWVWWTQQPPVAPPPNAQGTLQGAAPVQPYAPPAPLAATTAPTQRAGANPQAVAGVNAPPAGTQAAAAHPPAAVVAASPAATHAPAAMAVPPVATLDVSRASAAPASAKAAPRMPAPPHTESAQSGPKTLYMADLPPEVRRDLPPLAITGYIHSEQPGSRLVAINDRLMRIGDEVMPGLKVESIAPGYVLLSYKGWQFRISTP